MCTRVCLCVPPVLCAGDLKPSVSRALNQILQPVRDHFENNAEAKDLLKKVRWFAALVASWRRAPETRGRARLVDAPRRRASVWYGWLLCPSSPLRASVTCMYLCAGKELQGHEVRVWPQASANARRYRRTECTGRTGRGSGRGCARDMLTVRAGQGSVGEERGKAEGHHQPFLVVHVGILQCCFSFSCAL